MHTFSTYYPRHENSSNEEKSFEYISNTLKEAGIEFQRIGLGGFDNFHSFSEIIEAEFSGISDNDLYLVFPVNHPINASREESGAAGLALALELCRSLKESTPATDVHILFMGAEYGRAEEYQLGTRAFLENYYSDTPSQLLYLSLPSEQFGLDLRTSGTGSVAPAWFVEYTSDLLMQNRIPFNFSTMRFNLNQMGLIEAPTRIEPYLEKAIPAIHLHGVPVKSASNPDSVSDIDSLHDFLLNFIQSFPRDVSTRWDRHYLLYKIGAHTLLIHEFSYIIIILLLFAAVLLYPFFRRKRFYRYLHSIRRNGWVLPIIFALMFLYLLVATLLLEGIALYRQSSLMWQQQPFLLLLLKVSFAGFLFALSHRITAPFHFTRLRGSFYSASGLLFLLANVLILTTYNLSLTLYGAAIFLLGFLFTIVRNRITKLLYLLASVTFIVVVLLTIFRTGSSQAMYGILLSRIQGNLLISFHLLPYMLFTLRLRVLYHHPNHSLTRRITLASDFLFGTLTVAILVYLLFFYSLSPGSRQPLRILEYIDASRRSHTVSFESSEPLGSFTFGTSELSSEETVIQVDTQELQVEKQLQFRDSLLDIKIESRDFLERSTYTIEVTSPYQIEKLNITLASEKSITLYDSDFPVSPLSDPQTLQFHIGRFPSIPFSFSFTIPQGTTGTLETAAHLYSSPYETQIDKHRFDINYHLQSVQSVSLPVSIDTADPLK
ncbi:MAG: hypothetical protein ACOCW5_00210 [Spirochaetia bacterium]